MSPRERSNPYEQAKNKYEKVTNSETIRPAALMNALYNLEEAGVAQHSAGSLSLGELAVTMHDALTVIETPEYTKPPLSSEQFNQINGKRDTYSMIAEAQATSPEPAAEPTDTKKIDTAKHKG